jgi:hypothetical protein
VERKAWRLVCAVLLSLGATVAGGPVAGDEGAAPEELAQAYGKLGVNRVAYDASAEEELERR